MHSMVTIACGGTRGTCTVATLQHQDRPGLQLCMDGHGGGTVSLPVWWKREKAFIYSQWTQFPPVLDNPYSPVCLEHKHVGLFFFIIISYMQSKWQICLTLHMHNIFIQIAVDISIVVNWAMHTGVSNCWYLFKSGDRSKDYIRNDPCHFEV